MREQLVRIFLRYLAMWFVTKGFLASEDGSALANDPDLAMLLDMGVGFAIAGATEVWFWFARPSKEAAEVSKAVEAGQKVTIEGPRGGETVVQKSMGDK